MSLLQIFLVPFIFVIVSSATHKEHEHILVKRQSQSFPSRPLQRPFPLSRSRQFPPPEELEELSPDDSSDVEDEPPPPAANPPGRRPPASRFRGRQPVSSPEPEEDVNQTPAPQTSTPAPEKSTAVPGRVSRFGLNRNRLQLNSQNQTPKPSPETTSAKPAPPASNSRSRSRLSPRADIGLDILSSAPPPRSQNKPATPSSAAQEKPSSNGDVATRRSGTGRVRARGRLRSRTSSTTTTTTTTTTKAPPADDYYYYYYDEEEEALGKQPIATTTTTTTTTTTRPPARRPVPGRRPGNGRPSGFRPSTSSTTESPARAGVKFDPESQFAPPPEDVQETSSTERTTRKYTTSTTASPGPGGIPAHLAHKYKVRKDGRFIDYLRDPNRPRELKGFDLTDYPFYVKVPDDITFDCEDKKDGYYASVPHHCQLFHYCFAGARYDFLCANYTLYDQTTFTCRFANNVDCESSESYYYRNDDLWKETTTTSTTPEPKKKRKKEYDYEYEDEEDYDYTDEDEEAEEEERRRRPKRRRNRRRKNRGKSS